MQRFTLHQTIDMIARDPPKPYAGEHISSHNHVLKITRKMGNGPHVQICVARYVVSGDGGASGVSVQWMIGG